MAHPAHKIKPNDVIIAKKSSCVRNEICDMNPKFPITTNGISIVVVSLL